MCGIFGLIQPKPFDLEELNRVSRILRHRGPDDEGFLLASGRVCTPYGGADTQPQALSGRGFLPSLRLGERGGTLPGGLVLGHRRLSIIDLSPGGHQPMSYRDRHWLVFNGEVFNFPDLREELQALGHVFHTESDTEVVLAAYDQWGEECLSRFNGMWAMALYDQERETLFLARDRFGVKPLYLHASSGRLAFASEIKAFTGLAGWRPRANRARVLDYLVWSLTDQSEQTLFQDVVQVGAGCCLSIHLPAILQELDVARTPVLRPHRWYRPEAPTFRSSEEAQDLLGSLLKDAVRIRLRADVPVGSCLSGGLDSSTIVCLMQELLNEQGVIGQQQTFTASSSELALDESHYALKVIEKTGVQGHFVTPDTDRLFQDLEALAWAQDEPFISSSIFAQWCVFRLANAQGIRVMLDGQGADEILCGYRGFIGAYLAELFRSGRWGFLGSELGKIRMETGFSRSRSIGYLAAYLAPGLIKWMGLLDGRAYADREWIHPAARVAFALDPIHTLGGRSDSIQSMCRAQVAATNLPMLLRYEDRNSMAFSIEARTPFLDYRVVEACLAMPAEFKLGGGVSKGVLRRSMQGKVPSPILERKDKIGFVTAESAWLKSDSRPKFRVAIQSAVERFPTILAPAILDKFDAVATGKNRFDYRYWRVISLGKWGEKFNICD